MKKLLLSLLLAIPAMGFAGQDDISYHDVNVGTIVQVKVDGRTHVPCTIDVKGDATVIASNWVIPHVLYRQHYLQAYEDYAAGKWIYLAPYKSELKLSTPAKLVGTAAILAGIDYAAKCQFGADYKNEILKNLTQQKNDFTKDVITPVTNGISTVVNSVTTTLGSGIKAADGYLKGPREALGKGMSTVFGTIADMVNKTGWFKKTAEVAQAATQVVTETVTQQS